MMTTLTNRQIDKCDGGEGSEGGCKGQILRKGETDKNRRRCQHASIKAAFSFVSFHDLSYNDVMDECIMKEKEQ